MGDVESIRLEDTIYMNRFKNYQVTLHDTFKHSKIMKVRTCVSPAAACNVADYLDRMKGTSNPFRASMAYELDANNKPIYKN
jgi:hypothetical protein